jgi:hypothetical protein
MMLLCAGAAVAARGHAGAPGSGAELCHTGSQGVQHQVYTRDPR